MKKNHELKLGLNVKFLFHLTTLNDVVNCEEYSLRTGHMFAACIFCKARLVYFHLNMHMVDSLEIR